MRKLFALICVAAALTFVTGCGKSEPAPSSTPAPADGGAAPADKPAEETNP